MAEYYIGKIEEHHGEFECDISLLIATEKDADQRHEEITKDWYGIDLNEDPNQKGVYWNDCMTYQKGTLTKISKKTFQELLNKRVFVAFLDGDTNMHQKEDKRYEQSI